MTKGKLLAVGSAVLLGGIVGATFRSSDNHDVTSQESRPPAVVDPPPSTTSATRQSRGKSEEHPSRPALFPAHDIRSDEYDPVRVFFDKGFAPRKIFSSEPRNDSWASSFEKNISRSTAAFLEEEFPQAELIEVECRTSSCRINLRVPADMAKEAYALAQSALMFGSTVEPGLGALDEEHAEILLTSLLSPEHKSFGVLRDWREMMASTERGQAALKRFRDYIRNYSGLAN